MWFRSLVDSLKPRPSRPPAQRPRRRPKGSRVQLEILEDRTLPSFIAPVNYPVGVSPVAVVTADLNGDGKLDLVIANAAANNISVLLGNGDGTFQAARTYATGAAPQSSAVGDLNGDGKLDLVTANEGDNTVSVLLGNGDGTFQAAKGYAVGAQPVSVAVGDFDGKPDIVTANQGSDSVSLLPGNGDGTFATAQTAGTFGAPAASVAVGDFNGDGKLDLAATTRGTDGFWGGYYSSYYYSGNSPAVTVLLGNGNGTFATGISYTLPSPFEVPPSSYAPPSVAAADLTGDGKPDLVVTDAGDGAVDVLPNNGNGLFTAPTSFSTGGSSPDSVALADVNANGKLDIITADTGDNAVSMLPNVGNGNFGSPYTFPVGSGPAAVAAGNFNADGRTDVAVANSGSNNVSVLLNNGSWPLLQVTATDAQTGAAISSTTAGQSFNFTVTAEDQFGNVLTGFSDTISFSTSDTQGTIIDPATGKSVPLGSFTYNFTAADHGTHTFNVDLKTAPEGIPEQFLGVGDPSAGLAPAGSDIAVYPGPVSSFTVRFPSVVTAGTYGQLAVAAYDACGNLAYNATGTVVFSSTDPQAKVIDPATGNPVALAGFTHTFSPYDSGTASFSAALNTAGKNQSITATDSVHASAAGSQTGIEVDLAVTVGGPSGSYLNQPLTFTLGTVGDPAGTRFTYQINWGDGSPTQTVTGPSGTQVTHAYSTAGNRYASVTATDPGGLSGSFSEYVTTVPVTVAILTDPAHTSQQMLVITDSGYGDTIYLSSAANSVSLNIDGYNLGTVAPTNGNPFALVMVLSSTTGYETVNAGSLAVSSVLVGGSGSNSLRGSSSARNLLIAGKGYGTLYAGSAGDILIGGSTSYNTNTTALAYIMAEWDSGDSYSTRVSKISKGRGLNGTYVLNSTTVVENGVSDSLYGGAGLDWFFAHTKGKTNMDPVYNRTSGETVTSI